MFCTGRHVNRLCLAVNKPLIESGTTGYLGQVRDMKELKHEVFLETVPGKISGIVPEAAPGITSGTYSRNNTRKSIGNSRDVNRRKHDT